MGAVREEPMCVLICSNKRWRPSLEPAMARCPDLRLCHLNINIAVDVGQTREYLSSTVKRQSEAMASIRTRMADSQIRYGFYHTPPSMAVCCSVALGDRVGRWHQMLGCNLTNGDERRRDVISPKKIPDLQMDLGRVPSKRRYQDAQAPPR